MCYPLRFAIQVRKDVTDHLIEPELVTSHARRGARTRQQQQQQTQQEDNANGAGDRYVLLLFSGWNEAEGAGRRGGAAR